MKNEAISKPVEFKIRPKENILRPPTANQTLFRENYDTSEKFSKITKHKPNRFRAEKCNNVKNNFVRLDREREREMAIRE